MSVSTSQMPSLLIMLMQRDAELSAVNAAPYELAFFGVETSLCGNYRQLSSDIDDITSTLL